jgi:hypothetical protein
MGQIINYGNNININTNVIHIMYRFIMLNNKNLIKMLYTI